ncbi:hypothetical protein FoTM2_013717 [Fusarium oxysporum f. sp. vasinfectum]|nr:hypothetical protein FoTM2_013717 [Fusarium oxysporum f. sp. vasinfectum]
MIPSSRTSSPVPSIPQSLASYLPPTSTDTTPEATVDDAPQCEFDIDWENIWHCGKKTCGRQKEASSQTGRRHKDERIMDISTWRKFRAQRRTLLALQTLPRKEELFDGSVCLVWDSSCREAPAPSAPNR